MEYDAMQVIELSRTDYEQRAAAFPVPVPIEQLPVWQDLEDTVPGRSAWGYAAIMEGERELALISLVQYETHGYRYLRAHHAPVWAEEPTPEQESEALEALADFVRRRDGKQVFMRLAVAHELPLTAPCLSTLPYDTTVVIDLTGGDDEILARMKPRGRRDVRKALRECTLTFSDETERAIASFDEYYEVMVETAARDGFTPAPAEDYRNMLQILGHDHCRLFAGRDEDDRVITWTIATIAGTHATRYYGASRSGAARNLATDRLIYFECCELGRMGCAEYDQMGIGSEFQPATMGLNTFKTKFAKDGVRTVAPDRDVPIKKTFYRALVAAKSARNALRSAKHDK
ncbi:GNAT family N-acetyltransferase [Collinsella tanakaei]|nr:GNAT family N-acetyltransferase [Collinsella tanakaei]